jgi:hypothetical protein
MVDPVTAYPVTAYIILSDLWFRAGAALGDQDPLNPNDLLTDVANVNLSLRWQGLTGKDHVNVNRRTDV